VHADDEGNPPENADATDNQQRTKQRMGLQGNHEPGRDRHDSEHERQQQPKAAFALIRHGAADATALVPVAIRRS